ncbi:MAG: hypothetical protein AB7O96_15535 [Pseudobdellovibrionaceae bacterium]
MFKTFIFSTLLFVGVSAQAGWAGDWTGFATYTLNNGETSTETVIVSLKKEETLIALAESFFKESLILTVHGNELLMSDKVVGTFTEDKLSIAYDIHVDVLEETCRQAYEVSSTEGGITYVDLFTCPQGYSSKLEGILKSGKKFAIR